MSLLEPTRKVPKHLIDPANPRPRQSREERQADLARLGRVKQWVTSVLAVTTMFHLSVGLVIAAMVVDEDRVDARIGLNVIAGILMLAGIVGARVIHEKKPLSLWLTAGLIIPAIGLYLTFR